MTLIYTWKDAAGIEKTIYGEALVPGTGKYGVDAIGYITYTEERSGPIAKFQADAAAQNVLAHKITLGRSIKLEAVSALWLRPSHTVTIQLPTGEQERHLVQSVTFAPTEGRMTVTTRQPETLTS